MMTNRTLAAIAALLLTAGVAHAAPPQTISYSGYLTDSSGNPVGGSGTDMTFRIYATEAAALGSHLYEETILAVPTSASDGFFSVVIGLPAPGIPDAVFQSETWLAVKYGTTTTGEAEMTPRIRLASVPTAFTARTVAWSGISGRPTSSCSGATPFVTGIDANGAVTCGAAPSGAAGCAANQVLKLVSGAWTCSADTDTTYSVGAGLPLKLTGTVFSIVAANATTDGYLTSADWNTFNNKLTTVSVTAPITGNGTAGSPLAMPAATGAQNGYLSSANWTTFNNKLSTVSVAAPLTGNGTAGNPLGVTPATPIADGYLRSSDFVTFTNKVTSVTAATNGGLAVAGTTTPAVSLRMDCGTGQMLTFNLVTATWQCSTPNAGTVTNVTPQAGTPITVQTGSTTPQIGITQAGSAGSGYLTSTDWNTFNNKVGSVGATASMGLAVGGTAAAPTLGLVTGCANGGILRYTAGPPASWGCSTDTNGTVTSVSVGAGVPSNVITVTNNSTTPVINMSPASSLQPGYLTSTAFNTFNAKQNALVQSCGPGYSIAGINPDGTVSRCEFDDNSGGTVTSVTAGAGLTANGSVGGSITTSGTVALNYAGSGSSTQPARSDHNHDGVYADAPTSGTGSMSVSTSGGTLVLGSNYLYPTSGATLTLPVASKCLVTFSLTIEATVTNTTSSLYTWGVYKRASLPGSNYSTTTTQYYGKGWTSPWEDRTISVTAPVTVAANDATTFGCYTYIPTADFTYAYCYIAWMCF